MNERLKGNFVEQITKGPAMVRFFSFLGAGGIIIAELIEHGGDAEEALQAMYVSDEKFIAFIGLTAIGSVSHALRLFQLQQHEQQEE